MTTTNKKVSGGIVRRLLCVPLLWLCLIFSASATDCTRYPLEGNESSPPWADYIFDGKVLSITFIMEGNAPIGKRVVFRVLHVYKGEMKREVVITTGLFADGDAMGYPFLCGESYHVNARKRLSDIYTNQCMGVRPLSDKVLDADELGEFLFKRSDVMKKEKDKLWRRMICPQK